MSIDGNLFELRQMREQALMGGGQKRIDQQHAKGKYTAPARETLKQFS